jgi:tRNA A-37 threonylcarbamoyl transferase component Bud32
MIQPDAVIPEFRRIEANGRVLVVASDFEGAALALGLLEPGGLEQIPVRSQAGGRGATRLISLGGRAQRLHLRAVHHGGRAGGVLGRRLLSLARPLAELEVTTRLRARGSPVPQAVLVLGQRSRGLWRADVGTVYEEESVDGESFLRSAPSRARLLRAARAAGLAVRQLHDAGGRHADLHIGNLLVRERDLETQALIIDLDRARIEPGLSEARRMAELMRLHRSLVKRRLTGRVGDRGYAAFFRAYVAGDRGLRRALLTTLRHEQRRIALHALLYRS